MYTNIFLSIDKDMNVFASSELYAKLKYAIKNYIYVYLFSWINSRLGNRKIKIGAGGMITTMKTLVSNFIKKTTSIAVLNKSKIFHVSLCCIIYQLSLFTFNTNRNKKYSLEYYFELKITFLIKNISYAMRYIMQNTTFVFIYS